MLLTNIAVAEQVAVNFPEQALLRRHDTPLERRLVSRPRQLEHQLLRCPLDATTATTAT